MKRPTLSPPRLATKLFEWYCGNAPVEDLRGDLEELFYSNLESGSLKSAQLKYWQQVLSLLLSYALKKRKHRPGFNPTPRSSSPILMHGMIRHYLIVAFRNLRRNGTNSFINITGLSISLACCMLLLLYTKDETTYDRFHEKKDELYQLTVNRVEQSGKGKKFAMAAMIQGPSFKREIPEIEEYVRVRNQQLTVKKEDDIFIETASWVDDNFFSVFTFPLIAGNPKTVLSDIHSIVLSEETARNYFGSIDVMGHTMDIEVDGRFETFSVSGIARNCPQNSSIKFSMVLPLHYMEEVHPDNGWHWVSFPTYFLLHSKANVLAVSSKMARVYETLAKQEIDEMKIMGYGDKFIWGLQPFPTMHLNTEFEGTPEASDPMYAYILSGIALFILIIACINFINLTVAQSIRRGKEIGIRKVIGGQRTQLIGQFLGESFTLCFVAFVLAILLAQSTLPFFNDLANKKLSLSYLLDWKLVAGIAGLLMVTGFAAGFYPALVLSGFNPVKALYNRAMSSGKNYLAQSLVVIQFAFAAFLIISTLFVYSQFNFLTKMDLGYNDRNLIEITVGKAIMSKPLSHSLKTEFSNVPGVEVVAPRNVGRFSGPTQANEREIMAVYEHVDEEYLPALQIPLAAGRNFSKDFPADSIHSVMVNESFVKEAGWTDPLGKTIDFMNIPGWGNKKITVVGVVKDYHFESLKEKIKPEVFTMEPKLPLGKFLVRINRHDIPKTLKSLEDTYRKVLPYDPFQYSFKDELNYNSYRTEATWKLIITISSILTIFISCIGLFGLTALSTERRTKEIGIRKSLGASATQIVALISQDFVRLILIGFVIATPLVWFAIHAWLQSFAYRVNMELWIFAFAGLLAILVALLTIGVQALKSALTNPVNSLRSE